MQYNTVVIGEYITTKKQPKIAILIKLKLLNSLITQKHRNKENDVDYKRNTLLLLVNL